MSVVEACAAATSLLPSLEPLLGVSLAFNLAYLNLSKFAYINVVKTSIGHRLNKLDPSVRNRVKATHWYKQMEALASVETLDQSLPKKGKLWVAAPGIWGKFYNLLFYWRIGRGLSVLAVIHALVLLILGVGHNTGVLNWRRCDFSAGHLGNDYVCATLGLLWPIFVVTIGTLVCSSATRFVKYQTETLAEEAKTDAREALDQSEQAVDAAAPAAQGPHQPT